MFYYRGAVSEQRAARCIAAAGALLERGLPRDVESLHPRACSARAASSGPTTPPSLRQADNFFSFFK
jgi:hypothetical protein